MKTYFVLSIFVLAMLSSCSKSNDEFLNKVLNDFNEKSYFIAFDVKSNDYKGRVIIQNNDLYNFFNNTKGWDTTRYKDQMKKILVHRRTLKLNDNDLLKWHFLKVKLISSVLINASKGVNSFLENYFEGTMFKADVNQEAMNAVINQLFYWEIPVKLDSVTGQLMLSS